MIVLSMSHAGHMSVISDQDLSVCGGSISMAQGIKAQKTVTHEGTQLLSG